MTRTSNLSIVGTVSVVLAGCGSPDFKMMGGDAGVSIATDDVGRASTPQDDAGAVGSSASAGDAGASQPVTLYSSSTQAAAPSASPPDAGSDAQALDASTSTSTNADADVDAVVMASCDATQPPSAASCVITEEYGVFVAPSSRGGSDTTGTGTRTNPYATVSNALANLGALSRVYVCNGAYTDQITVRGSVSIFGGMTCGAAGTGPWLYAGGASASVTGSSPAFALQVTAGRAAVAVEDMTFNAAPGTAIFPSSVAAFVIGSSAVAFRRTTLLAAEGYAGANGAPGASGKVTSWTATGDEQPLDGTPGTATIGGDAKVCTCAGGAASLGGAGGTSGADTSQNGLPVQMAPSPATATGAGQSVSACGAALLASVSGVNGSNAVPALAPDGLGASLGGLDTTGWHPSNGTAGADGSPGQGGGGGGAFTMPGGGGACGGCGGSGGGFGTGGGGSIALLAIDSPVQLVAAILTSGEGGPGGSGGPGGAGEAGGTGGAAVSGGCSGGNGGAGGSGGGGGGGAGGVSLAILFQGAAPVADLATTLNWGSPGVGGAGGDPTQNDGAPGYAAPMVDVRIF